MRALLLLLASFGACHGFVYQFRMFNTFGDKEIWKEMIFDISSPESFVLSSAHFKSQYGKRNVYDPKASKNFENLTLPLTLDYAQALNQQSSWVTGYWARDTVKLENLPAEVKFGVATKISGEDRNVEAFDGKAYAGRIGFSKALLNGSMGDAQLFGPRKLSLDLDISKDETRWWSQIIIGDWIYPKKDLRTKVKAIDNSDGLWWVNVSKVSIEGFASDQHYEATFSTTFNGITVPSEVFKSIIRVLKAQYDGPTGKYLVACNLNHPLNFEIGGVDLAAVFNAYVEPDVGGLCRLKLRDGEDSKTIVLGAPIYLKNAIGFDYKNDEVALFACSIVENDMMAGVYRMPNGAVKFVDTGRL